MENNLVVMTDFLINKEITDIGSLVPRELNDFSQITLVLYISIALKSFLQCASDSLGIKVISQTLNGCDTLSAISLLDTNVDVPTALVFLLFREGVGCLIKIADIHLFLINCEQKIEQRN